MTKEISLGLFLLALVVGITACTPADREDPLGPSGSSGNGTTSSAPLTPVVGTGTTWSLGNFTVLTYNTVGVFNGLTLTPTVVSSGYFGPSGIPDTASGAPDSVRVRAGSTTGAAYLTMEFCPWGTPVAACPMDQFPNLSSFAGETLHFNMMVETPLNEVNNIWVYYGPDNCKFGYQIPKAQMSNTGFVHYAIPSSSFSFTGCYTEERRVNAVFQINMLRTVTGTAGSMASLLINDVRWAQ